MQHIDFVIPCKSNSLHYFTTIGCAHIEARLHHRRLLDELLTNRAALPNHHFGFLGDFDNAINAMDEKRYTAHETNLDIVKRTDYFNATIDMGFDICEPISSQLDFILEGNHEFKVIQKYGLDPISILIDRLRRECNSPARWGGYVAMITYHFVPEEEYARGKATHAAQFRLLAAHGAWGGQGKGVIQTIRWAATMPDFDVCNTAHSHGMIAYPEPRLRSSRAVWRDGQVLQRQAEAVTRWFVNSGTYLMSYNKHDQLPDYGERAGHPVRHLGAPLIIVKPVFGHGIKVDVMLSTETGALAANADTIIAKHGKVA
jgi:hypothetical protein